MKNLRVITLALLVIVGVAAIGCEQAPNEEWKQAEKNRPDTVQVEEDGTK